MIGPIKVSRSLKELSNKIKEVQREYLCKKGEDISISEISKILNVSKEEIAMALESERPLESIDEDINEKETKGETKIGKISNGVDETNVLLNKMCIEELIKTLWEYMKCNQRVEKADCIIVLVLFPNPISRANETASMIYNLAFLSAKAFLNELGIHSNNSASDFKVFNKNLPPSFNDDNISYFSTYVSKLQATKSA